MNINFEKFPCGGYGVVLYAPKVGTKYVINEFEKIRGIVKSIVGEKLDGTQLTFTIVDFLKMFDTVGVCFKLFFNDDGTEQRAALREKSIAKKLSASLSPTELSSLTPYTLVNECYYFVVNLSTPVDVKVYGKTARLQRLEFTSNTVYPNDSDAIKMDNINSVIYDLITLNKRGVFHRDVKKENIAVTSTNKTKLIDFGSSVIDVGGNMSYRDFFQTRFVHPKVYEYFCILEAKTKGGELPNAKDCLMSNAKSCTMSQLVDTIPASIISSLQKNSTEHHYIRYMLHKKDCYDLAQSLFMIDSIGQIIRAARIIQQGGLFSCFRPQANAIKTVLVDVKIDVGIPRYRKKFQDILGDIAPLLYFDEYDYEDFKTGYIIQTCHSQGVGGQSVKSKKTQSHVRMKNGKKIYKVRLDNGGRKYVSVNKNNVYLLSMKNRYVYVQV